MQVKTNEVYWYAYRYLENLTFCPCLMEDEEFKKRFDSLTDYVDSQIPTVKGEIQDLYMVMEIADND
ncbi:MAG: hypothetical protein NC350_00235 [Corallococcus sp.]|nr:hypothetical protein [Corallococcus sp.]